ncbi:hypothetical protein KID03_08610 [bacterium]|nr:hypothetical protein [bacterium]
MITELIGKLTLYIANSGSKIVLEINMTTPFQKHFKDICLSLGKNNKALYGALTIAVSKGILRPTFTMMDKKQEKASRTYTAFREGLTGAVAFGSYLVTDAGVEKLAKHIAVKTNHVKELPKMKSTLSLITVSLTALFVIPGICNAATKPLLDKFITNKKAEVQKPPTKTLSRPEKQDVNFNGYQAQNMYHFRNFYSSGMKIGGI